MSKKKKVQDKFVKKTKERTFKQKAATKSAKRDGKYKININSSISVDLLFPSFFL